MCERYVMPEAEQAEREFGVERRWWQFSPASTSGRLRYVPVIRMHDSEVEGVMLRWGLIPDWAEADAAKACASAASISEIEHAPRRGAPGARTPLHRADVRVLRVAADVAGSSPAVLRPSRESPGVRRGRGCGIAPRPRTATT